MTIRVLLFVAKAVAISAPLVWFWMEWGRGAYGRFFTTMAMPIYELLELEMQPGGARERYVNYIPFLVLMFVTPRISILRRVMGTLVGMMALFTFHLIFSVWVQIAYPEGARGTTGGFAIYLPAILLSDSMPLVLWALLCHDFVRHVGSQAFDRIGLTAMRAEEPASPPELPPDTPGGS